MIGNQSVLDVKLFESMLDGRFIEIDNALRKLQARNATTQQIQEEMSSLRERMRAQEEVIMSLQQVWTLLFSEMTYPATCHISS